MTSTRNRTKPNLPTAEQAKPLRPPSEREKKAIADSVGRRLRRRPRVAARFECNDGRCEASAPHSDDKGWADRMSDAFGTTSNAFARSELNRVLNALAPNEALSTERANAILAIVDGARPRDEIEAMLVGQMAVTHALALELIGRATRAEFVPQFESAGNMAVKLLRTYTAQVEALAKLRRGGEQTVRVEHVHVYPGGQAVVGNVNHRTGGGVDQNAGQPQATDDPRALAFAPGSPVWSADPQRDAVPLAGGEAQGPMPDARRREG